MNLDVIVTEIKAIFKQWEVWYLLATQDIRLRYRRSAIGPFWITISMAVTVYTMGFLYGHLFKVNIQDYFPYLASGIIGWNFISLLILESSNTFIESEPYIKNQESFMSLFVMRLILRNLIVFGHNLIVFIPIVFIFHVPVTLKLFLLIPAIFVIALNVMIWGSFLAVMGTRYRDFAQIITSLVQVIFFLTPIMWMPSSLPERLQWVVIVNPFNQFLNLIRDPLLNLPFQFNTILVVGVFSVIGFMFYANVFARYKNRIVFWL